MKCTRIGCSGQISDGYCNVCGMPPREAAQTPSGRGIPGHVPTLKPSGPCQMPDCRGRIVDGYCDTCGSPAGATPPSAALGATTSRIGTVSLGSARVGTDVTRSRLADTRRAAGHLGAGYTTIPPEPVVDPQSAILKNPEVPEDKRFCPHCEAKVGRSTKDSPGRVEGYCPSCRKPFSFTPKLSKGDIVAGQYEVKGCLAHGGMGWIYLATDRNVSDRWVVLKGLLNVGDEASMQAAMTEQRFLATVQHPLIVEIYNFVTHEGGAYIVMEFVGGRSIKQILKARMEAAKGVYDPLPVEHALAYVLEILPAMSYLHNQGLLYCDFKPDNLMHLQDSVKLIDLGGVRPIDDDDSVIFGTVGYQAPEVSTQGCTITSDVYTVGRTLLICCAEVKGYQTTYKTSLPPIEEIPIFAQYDSIYRLIAKACATNASDRFQSMDEMRHQMLGVLREAVAITRGTAATTSAPSDLFEAPTVVSDVFTWKHLPKLKPEPSDPGLVMLASIDPSMEPRARYQALLNSPTKTQEVQLALCLAAIENGVPDTVTSTVSEILTQDPWEWRAAWIEGLAALNTADWTKAQSCFNAVYGQIPGELAPKFALAVACEMGGELEIAEQLYHICSVTDGAYVAGAAFGLARVRAKKTGSSNDPRRVLDALDLVPTTSGGWSQSRRLAASYLTQAGQGLPDLVRAYEAIRSAGANTEDRLKQELEIFQRVLPLVSLANRKAARGATIPMIGEVPITKADVRAKLETILRQQATLEHDPAKRAALIDQANSLRKWSIL